jgi:hypothetical protein
MKQVSQELKKLTSFSKQVGVEKVYDRTKSAASHALIGLKFINKKTDGDGVGWFEVEKQFEILSSDDGLLHRSLFAKCIGIVEYKSMFECFVTVVPTLLIRDVVSGVGHIINVDVSVLCLVFVSVLMCECWILM